MCEQDNNYHQVNMSSPKRLTEAQKANLPEIYILNPASNKYVLKSGPTGKLLAQGKPVQPKVTGSAKIVEILDLVKTHLNLSDEDYIDLINKLPLPKNIDKSTVSVKAKTPSPKDNSPKKANSFALYFAEQREKDPSMKREEILAFWKDLSAEEKKPYEDKAAQHNISVPKTEKKKKASASESSPPVQAKPTKKASKKQDPPTESESEEEEEEQASDDEA